MISSYFAYFKLCLSTFILFMLYWQLVIANITTTQFLRDPETLVSNNSNFRFGFFSPSNSSNRYVAIWYNFNTSDSNVPEVLWIANRDNPLNDTSGVLRIAEDGNLQLFDGRNRSYWSSNETLGSFHTNELVARLLDTGNLVLVSNASENILWQSFDHPTNALVPPVSFAVSANMEDAPILRSWRSPSDPSTGRYRCGVNIRNFTEVFIWDGDTPYWRSGPWSGNVVLGIVPYMSAISFVGFTLSEEHGNTFYMTYSLPNGSLSEHIKLHPDGNLITRSLRNNGTNRNWRTIMQSRSSECDVYGRCGPFASCNPRSSPMCTCLDGFVPTNNEEWSMGNWRRGCVRRTPLQCGNSEGRTTDGFLRLRNMKVPDNAQGLAVQDESECRRRCLALCSCNAYAYYFGIGCMIWNESLIDIQQFPSSGTELSLFIRLADSELGNNRNWTKVIVPVVLIGVATITATLYGIWRWKRHSYGNRSAIRPNSFHNRSTIETSANDSEFQDMPLYDFEKLVIATNNFDENNKLGRGGFGPVYKGKLEDGQEIAVKRLSRASGQGQEEFVNEVNVILKLQHKNLVKLLGCCIQGEEKLLVYELLPKKSLAALLFDQNYREELDWKKRFEIINGICRGVLYLHRDSRFKIIHRDLKASNILLDEELNPKISDFGLARIFGGTQDQATTVRVVGTYGYMSPEYAMEGRFSEKSDIYSLGVLLLEIVSGRRNSSKIRDSTLNLLSYAWKLWNEDNIVSIIDPTISDPSYQEEILRCLHVGLLCVQENPEYRPSISTLITMLDTELMIELPNPQRLGVTQSGTCSSLLLSEQQDCSVNLVSLTCIVDGR